VLAVVIGLGIVDRATAPGTAVAPPSPTALVAPPGAQSSTWYCAGATGQASGTANASLVLTNTTAQPTEATLAVVSDAGARASTVVHLAANAPTVVQPTALEQGGWLAAEVVVSSGGVVVTQSVQGPSGWSESACASRTADHWYFPSGTTTSGNLLYLSLFNPSTSATVADLTFMTPQGVQQPQPFQGIVLAPGQLQVVVVGTYVQDQGSVSTVVTARSGQLVAAELQVATNPGTKGLSLATGVVAPADRWSLPRTFEPTAGVAVLSVLNPTMGPETVRLAVRLASGPVAPLTRVVPARSTWVLPLSDETRVPRNADYSALVTSSGGAGVVVGRGVALPGSSPLPQYGLATAVDGPSIAVASHEWWLPGFGTAAAPAVPGAQDAALAVQNTGSTDEQFEVLELTATGLRAVAGLGPLTVAPGGFSVLAGSLFAAASVPLVVRAGGPLAVWAEGGPSGAPGAVAVGGIPSA
jgi:hypothetical protein